MRGRSWRRRCRDGWTSGWQINCGRRHAGTRSPCWSCRGDCRRRSWRAGSGCRERCRCRARIEESFVNRLEALPEDTQQLLLVAAAEPTGDPACCGARLRDWESLTLCSTRRSQRASSKSTAGFGFAIRSHARRSTGRRRRIRGDGFTGRWPRRPTRSLIPTGALGIWPRRHPVRTRTSPLELESAAGRAQARGGLAAAAAFLERAATLTREPSRRAARALAAAQAEFEAGALDDALALLGDRGGRRGRRRTNAPACICSALRSRSPHERGSDAPQLLLKPLATSRRSTRTSRARPTWRRCPRRCSPAVWPAAAAWWRSARPRSPAPRRRSRRVRPISSSRGWRSGSPTGTRRARRSSRRRFARSGEMTVLPPEEARWLWFASWVALYLWDDEAWAVLSTRHLDLVREAGALTALPFVLTNRSSVYAFFGELGAAAAYEEELKAVTEATGIATVPYGALALAALRGREAELSDLIQTTVSEAQARGEGLALTITEFVSWNAVPRARSLSRGANRGGASRALPRGGRGDLGADRADRGGRPVRTASARGRGDGAGHGDDPRQRDRMGARDRGPVPRTAQRRPRRRDRRPLSQGDRAFRLRPPPRASGPRPPPLR